MFGFFDVVTAGYLIEFTSRPPEGKRKENHTNTREPGPRSGPGDRNAGIVGQGLGTEDDGNGGTSLPLVIFNPPPNPQNKSWRPILNLRSLNRAFIKLKGFRMETLAINVPSLNGGMLTWTVDLKGAYLHVPIHLTHHLFLAFNYTGVVFKFKPLVQYCIQTVIH